MKTHDFVMMSCSIMDGRIFISSVQKEFAQERKSLRSYIESDPLLRDFFSVYLFESGSARSKRSDEVYLSELDKSGIYLCLIGDEYGSSDIEGISPTQREYEHALNTGKKILVFVKESKNRTEREEDFLRAIESRFVRKKFFDLENLKTLVYESLLELLREDGLISTLPFSMRIARDISWNDLDLGKIRSFARDAGERRGFKLKPTESAKNILTHMGLFSEGKITNSAVLLFGKNPQRKFTTSCVKCLHLRGTEIEKPFLDTKYFDGTLFEMIDKSVDFVLSKLGSGIGSREKRGVLPFEYEIPRSVIFEAIANAVAHRNYASDGSVQVMVFSDRVVIMNPGNLPSGLFGKKIFEPHESLSPNRLIAQALFWAGYIETLGSGFIDMKNACRKARLPIPKIENVADTVTVTLSRPKRMYIPQAIPQVTPQVTPQVEVLLNAISGEMKASDLMKAVGISDRKHFRKDYISVALKDGLIEMTIPDKPKSSNQKYRITPLGIRQISG